MLIICLYLALHLPVVQQWLVNRATAFLSKELGTTVKIDRVYVHFYNRLELDGLLILDKRKDTLLSAGSVQVNVTDWFFLRDKVTLKYLSLSHANVQLQRTDSVWNHQFIIDYFGGRSSTTASNQEKNMEFDIEEIHFRQLHFLQRDGWVGHDQEIYLKGLDLQAKDIDFKKRRIAISSLFLDEPRFIQQDYTGNREKLGIPKKKKPAPDPNTPKPPFEWNPDNWIVDIRELQVFNGLVNVERETQRATYTDRFDGQHLRFEKISGSLQQIHIEKDTLDALINLSTRERSGFEVKQLSARFRFSPHLMEFNQLNLETNQSRLGNYYAMAFDDFEDDMSDFLSKVRMTAAFENSTLNTDDIGFFAPEVKSWKKIFSIAGNGRGTVENLKFKQLDLRSGSTQLAGDLILLGLPDIDETFIDLKAETFTTSYYDLVTIAPSLRQVTTPNLKALGDIRFRGTATGFLHDFVAFGDINSRLGTMTADLNMKFPDQGKPSYSGKIKTESFELGQFINNKTLGPVTLDASVKGSGFQANDIQLHTDAYIKRISVAGRPLQEIKLMGEYSKNLFRGEASINDPNMQINGFKGTIDLDKQRPEFNFTANLNWIALKPLGLTLDDFCLSGLLNINFTGADIDDFLGSLRIRQGKLTHLEKPLSFDSLALIAVQTEQGKQLTLRSNQVDAQLDGRFKLLELPQAFEVLLHKYYPAYFAQPNYNPSDQHFNYRIQTRDVDPYVRLIDKRLAGFNNATLEGSLFLDNDQLDIAGKIPSFSYDGIQFNNIRLRGTGRGDSLLAIIDADDIALNDSMHLPTTNIQLKAKQDISRVTINTSASKTISSASIDAEIQTFANGVDVHFFPSSIILNDRKWQLEEDGEISLRNQLVTAKNIRFVQGNQQLIIETETSGLFDQQNDVVVKLKNINVNDFTGFLLPKPRLEGIANGELRIENAFETPYIVYNTTIDQLRVDNDSIGQVRSRGNYSNHTGLLRFNARAENPDNQFNVTGKILTRDSTENATLIAIQSKRFNLALLNTYLRDILEDISGYAETEGLTISGSPDNLLLTGKTKIADASMRVSYTKCLYRIRDEEIVFGPDRIELGTLTLRDSLNNTATLSGTMRHDLFNNFVFQNLRFDTRKLLLLQTTKRDNNQFYGRVIGEARLNLTGTQDDMVMNITGRPSETDSSHIYILSGSSAENGGIDYIDFIQFGKQVRDEAKAKLASRILVNMTLTATPACNIDVILDEATGDIIKGQGRGILNIRVGNNEPLTINGRYDITRGEYTFNFQTFLKKYFTVNSGSITWNGDPYQAKIDILAEYLANNVDFSNISAATGFRQRSDLRVVAHLTETLLKPYIDFEFLLPDASALRNDFIVTKRLQQFREDKNELNKQVTSLLLFNTFINNNSSFINASSGYNVLSSTIGGVVSNMVSGFFNKFLQRYLKNTSLYLDVNSSMGTDLQRNVATLQAAAKSGLVFTLMNGRLVITAGVNLDYNNPYAATANNVLVTPDITAEWILTRDGRVRVVGFNRTNFDIIGQRNRTGVNLSYRKEAERLRNLFSNPTKRRKRLTLKDDQ